LWVKASGQRLSNAEKSNIFVGVDLNLVRRRVAEGCGDNLIGTVVGGEAGLRPSIETTLHALLPHEVVLHVHSVRAIAVAVRTDANEQLAARLQGLRWRLVPYCRPGLPLTKAVAKVMQDEDSDVIVLANHGLVVGGANCAEARALLAEVERRLNTGFARPSFAADLVYLQILAKDSSYGLPCKPACHALAASAGVIELAASGSLYPDHVVFLGPAVAIQQADKALPRDTGAGVPAVLVVPGKGVLVRQGLSFGAEEMVHALALVLNLIPDGTSVRYLSQDDECELLNWDAEKYRQALSGREGTACKS
jgi:rhamnose utilization protein RhaD (predicted bifunctional aldolase and dehydrogenase)